MSQTTIKPGETRFEETPFRWVPFPGESLQGRIIQIDSDPAPNGKQVLTLQIEMPESELVPFADYVLETVRLTITK